MPPVNHDHVDARLGDQRVDECHPSGTGAHNEVVGLDQAHPSSLRQAKAYLRLSGCSATRNRTTATNPVTYVQPPWSAGEYQCTGPFCGPNGVTV